MKTKLLLFISFIGAFFTGKAQVNVNDSLALVNLYNATQPNNGWLSHKNWLTPAPVSTWYGVAVKDGRVIIVSLASNRLTGNLPSSIGNLSELTTLELQDNQGLSVKLTGSVIGKLTKLQSLNLHYTKTSGVIPEEMAQLTNLGYLDISNCSLTGTLPDSIGKLAQLGTLDLSENQMSGTLPASLGKLSSMVELNLSGNQLSGSVPQRGNMPKLLYLFLSRNQFSGNFPGWFGKSKPLTIISISSNNFTGTIPGELDSLKKLASLYASYNHFSGPIPEWLLTKRLLFDLFIDHNDFSQPGNPCTKLSNTIVDMDLSYNKYNFNGLECLTEDLIYYIIAPQAQLHIGQSGDKLTVSAGGTLRNNTYTWYKEGSTQTRVIIGDSTFAPPRSGRYYAKVTSKVVTTLTLYTDTVSYVKPSGIMDLNITLSPNPAKSMMTLYGLNGDKDIMIRVADITGYVWLSAASHKRTSVPLNVASLKPGHYVVTLSDGYVVRTFQFVKE